jgi:hypothetical protein
MQEEFEYIKGVSRAVHRRWTYKKSLKIEKEYPGNYSFCIFNLCLYVILRCTGPDYSFCICKLFLYVCMSFFGLPPLITPFVSSISVCMSFCGVRKRSNQGTYTEEGQTRRVCKYKRSNQGLYTEEWQTRNVWRYTRSNQGLYTQEWHFLYVCMSFFGLPPLITPFVSSISVCMSFCGVRPWLLLLYITTLFACPSSDYGKGVIRGRTTEEGQTRRVWKCKRNNQGPYTEE